jgi:ATP-dependent Clp protease ATP-binding subunit ClpC
MDESHDDELIEEPVSFELDQLSACVRTSLDLAKSRAQAMGDTFVGTDHVLLGLALNSTGAAFRVLESLALTADQLQAKIVFIRGGARSPLANGEDPTYSPRLQRVLASAAKDAAKRNHTEIGTLHVLSGIMREREGIATLLLESPGVGLGRTGSAIALAHREGWRDVNGE